MRLGPNCLDNSTEFVRIDEEYEEKNYKTG